MVTETSQTLDRGLRVLSVLSSTTTPLTVTELASELGVNRTVVYRLVATLEQHSLVRRDGSGRLHVGLGVLRLAASAQPVLREVSIPVLRHLAESMGVTAHLTISDGEEALALAVVEPTWTDFHVSYRVGARHPLSRGAAGRAILLSRGDQTSAYSITTGELQPGAHGLAAPILGVDGLDASIGVITLGETIDEDTVAPRVIAAAQEIADQLR